MLTESAEKETMKLLTLTQTNNSLPFITVTSDGPIHWGYTGKRDGVLIGYITENVKSFFDSGYFSKGCNSSFITLIPKIPDAKLVKVNEVQSAFVADRQILDGPFILNEVYQWCKAKRKQSFVLKIDFEKAASGLCINVSKSKLIGIAVKDDYIHQAANRIGCGILKTPFSYLGSKVGGNVCRICSWDEVVDKLIARLSKWKMKTLSIGGRLTLLKAVLGSLPIYHMSIFKVPKNVLHRMESIRSRFFNGIDLNSKKAIWVKWSKVLASKEKGGLGVSSFYALNRALMFKWVWRFKTQKDLLWSRVIKALHGDNGRIGNCSRIGYKSVWCDIIREVEVVKAHGFDLYSYIQKKIGNGENTSFWDDVWIGDTPLKSKFSRLYALEDSKRISVASKMAQENWSGSFRRVPRSGAEQAQMEELIVLLEAIDDSRLPVVSSQTRWIMEVPIKINIHAWKVRLDCLPTRLNLSSRGLDIPSILCPSCGVIVETTSHVFFQCELAKDLFRMVCNWWNVAFREVYSFDDWVLWINSIRLSTKLKNLLQGVCYGIWWRIWIFQNKLIFGDSIPAKAVIFDDVVLLSFYWIRYRRKGLFSWVEWLKNPHLLSL
ncbi:RNA-directed DNA polymerase, eukaryota, reverse transcriptase zinc-binding domain protein [Tanacetum coccineum]